MKSLQYSNDSQQSVKIGDTDTTIKLLFNKDNQVVDLTAASSINLKVADSQHAYIKTVSIDISNQSDLANGYLTVDLNDALISGLPSGTYYFEMWVNIDNETEIYPDSGFKSFVIKNNIEQGSSSYTTITLNDISAKLTETANTLQANVEQSIKDEISNGDFKGDKGDPGNTGNGIASIATTYGVSSDVNTQPTSWNATIPPYSSDEGFYWIKVTISMTDGTSYNYVQNSNFEDLVAKANQMQGDIDTVSANLAELIQLQNQNAIGKEMYTAYANDEVGTNFTNALNPNLLTGTSDWSGTAWYAGLSSAFKNGTTYQGLTVIERKGAWNMPYQIYTVSTAGVYTFSVWVKQSLDGVETHKIAYVNGSFVDSTIITSKAFDWTRITITMKSLNVGDKIQCRVETNGTGDLFVAGYKLEKGSVATPYIPNIADSNYLSSFFKYKGIGLLNSTSYSDYDWSQSDEFRDFKEQQLTNAILALGGTV